MRYALLTVVTLLCGSSFVQAATLRVVDQEFDFAADDSMIDVDVVVEDAADVAGLEFSLVYPGDVLAVAESTSHQPGNFLASPVVNHEGDPVGLPAGSRRINVALAAAEASGQGTATVLTISFPLRCSEFSGDWPDGRVVDVQIVDAVAWGIGGGGLPEALALTPIDGSLLIDCSSVPVSEPGFSALKARFGGRR